MEGLVKTTSMMALLSSIATTLVVLVVVDSEVMVLITSVVVIEVTLGTWTSMIVVLPPETMQVKIVCSIESVASVTILISLVVVPLDYINSTVLEIWMLYLLLISAMTEVTSGT
jgi:hypothetical protein